MSGIIGSRLNIRGSGLVGSLGTDGQVFTSSGAGAGAVYEAVSGGKILQIVQTTSTSGTLHNSISTYTASNVTGAITPTAASSKIIVQAFYLAGSSTNGNAQAGGAFKLYRDIEAAGFAALWPGTVGGVQFQIRHTHGTDELTHRAYQTIVYLDAPSYTLTDEITYTLYGAAGPSGYGNVSSSPDGDSAAVILMEVAA